MLIFCTHHGAPVARCRYRREIAGNRTAKSNDFLSNFSISNFLHPLFAEWGIGWELDYLDRILQCATGSTGKVLRKCCGNIDFWQPPSQKLNRWDRPASSVKNWSLNAQRTRPNRQPKEESEMNDDRKQNIGSYRIFNATILEEAPT